MRDKGGINLIKVLGVQGVGSLRIVVTLRDEGMWKIRCN